MPFLALFTNLAFYHFSLLAFHLGSQIYQSFFANLTAQRALTRSQFSILQAAIWPMYFRLQTILSILLALTYPGTAGGGGGGGGDAASFFPDSATSLQGLLSDEQVRKTALLPLASIFVFSVSNAVVWVPGTTRVMRRLHVETAHEEKTRASTASQSSDDKINLASVRAQNELPKDDKEKSPKVKALTKKFLVYHAASYFCAMGTLAASGYYAICVAERCL